MLWFLFLVAVFFGMIYSAKLIAEKHGKSKAKKIVIFAMVLLGEAIIFIALMNFVFLLVLIYSLL